ncbi:MAG: hypothetical protein EON55_01285 [Alphaproteobacteria bacterium]|nr:MAG: hypothetical protein EON55_01285 [Alphaproteobacteria bacterium]
MIVLVPRRLLTAMTNERIAHLPNETGGFLIGTRRGPHIEVTELTTQGRGDRSTSTTFERLCPSHRERIHSAWRSSGATETMVGDWHSHPVGSSRPSGTDRSAWRSLVRSNGLPMIGVIDAGATKPGVYLAVGGRRPVESELAAIDDDGDALFFGFPAASAAMRPCGWRSRFHRMPK